jgi:hypothetical protein
MPGLRCSNPWRPLVCRRLERSARSSLAKVLENSRRLDRMRVVLENLEKQHGR